MMNESLDMDDSLKAGPGPLPLNRPYVHPAAVPQLAAAVGQGNLVGDGLWGRRCEARLREICEVPHALLTPSATAALELAVMSLNLGPGDEVVLPAFTFPSCANAVALRGATPVFCDVRADTLNVGAAELAACLGPRTRAAMVVHYAGNPAALDELQALCRQSGIALIEDAAQALGASLHGKAAGSWGDFAAFSFHGSKNIGCGEGGALLINDAALAARAEIHREKGTDRSRFLRREVDKYCWQDLGSSWVVSELVAAYLDAQLQGLELVSQGRRERWQRYAQLLEAAERAGRLRRPVLTAGALHNGHSFHVLLDSEAQRDACSRRLREQGIEATRHFVPLHQSPAGQRFGRVGASLAVTERSAATLLRLPLWHDMAGDDQERVVEALLACL